EGAAMMRTKGEAGTGNIIEAVRHIRAVSRGISSLKGKKKNEIAEIASEMRVSVSLVEKVIELGRLPVVNFAAGGIATPADAALCMQLGCDGVFVGSGIFKSSDPERRAQAIVDAVAHFSDAKKIALASEGLGSAMMSLDMNSLKPEERFSKRGI
ncbi:MAG: pyridoxal 5'-phosphate synthase lyase subunit PdxS, partial [Candidatus Micrarchaeia archaeon]